MKSMEHVQHLAKGIVPALAYKEDVKFEDWQKKAHKKLEGLLGLPLQKCDNDFQIQEETDCGTYRQIRFLYQSEPDYYVPCTLLVPKKLRKPLPCVICLQGHSTGAHISLGIAKFSKDEELVMGGRDFAVRAVKEGYCAIALEQRYMGEMGQNVNGTPACLSENAAMAGLLIGRTAIGERVWDIHRLIDVIEEDLTEYIDTHHIMCMGNSGGGTATFYASCYDRRISLSIPSCAVCTYEASIMAMYHCPCNFIPNIRNYFNMGDLGALIAPRPLVVVCGKDDSIFPLEGVRESFEVIQRAYRHIGKEDLCRLVIGNGGHQFYPDDAWPVANALQMQQEKEVCR